MGNQKFKLTNIIPNTWFYKLKNINISSKPPPSSPPPTTTTTTATTVKPLPPPPPEPHSSSRKSYHISRDLTIDLPNELDSLLVIKSPSTKSKSIKSSRVSSSISTSSCQSSSTFPSETDNNNGVGYLDMDVLLKVELKENILKNNALVDNNYNKNNFYYYRPEHDTNLKIQLPPIKTKTQPHVNTINETRKMTVMSPRGVRLKTNSPRIVRRKQGQNRHKKSTSSKKQRSISESYAVVKSSYDPQNDFRESMVEMIQQNNLTAAKDLEDLLACFLSLNSDEYHHLIIKVFKQIWIDFRHPK